MQHEIDLRRTVYYLGNKAKLAKKIDAICADEFSENMEVLDLFSGSGSSAREFAKKRRVVANDIQNYACIICSAILADKKFSSDYINSLLQSEAYCNELMKMKETYSSAIERENEAIHDSSDSLHKVADFFEAHHGQNLQSTGRDQFSIIDQFGGLYFSYEQACELQAMANFSDGLDHRLRIQFLATVLSVASRVSNTVGNQFAQPLKLFNNAGEAKRSAMLKFKADRVKSVSNIFKDCSNIYSETKVVSDSNIVSNFEANVALTEHLDKVGFVYADPPYGREHYSRYYHVLETIALNDNPDIVTPSTMMRSDRYQSRYCIMSKAKAEFENLFFVCSKARKPIALSYADKATGSKNRNRVVSLETLIDCASNHFDTIKIFDINTTNFSQLNRSSLASQGSLTREILLIAK